MYGKLGHGNEAGHSTPKRVDALVGLAVSQIACGSRHTAIITSSGAIYTWGDKENGVAGHGDTDGHQYTPKLLERLAGKRYVTVSIDTSTPHLFVGVILADTDAAVRPVQISYANNLSLFK